MQSRQSAHVEDYVRRTAQKAWSAPEVTLRWQERQVARANFDRVRRLAHTHGFVYALVIHPLYVDQATEDDLPALRDARRPAVRAAGEVHQPGPRARPRGNCSPPLYAACDCNGQVAAAAPAYLVTIEQALDAVAARQERARRLEAIRAVTARVGGHDPLGEYRRQAQQLIVKYGAGADLARMDWMIAVDMATSGRFTAYFSPSWTPFQADRGRDFRVIVDGVSG